MIARFGYLNQLQTALRRSPVVALIGPRQAEKPTLARQVAAGSNAVFFDLEDTAGLGFPAHPRIA